MESLDVVSTMYQALPALGRRRRLPLGRQVILKLSEAVLAPVGRD
jgi:hypothetical protein